MKRNNKGFTLVELIATISIMLLITTIAVPTIMNMINNKEKDECKSYIEQFETLAELYASDHKNTIINSNPKIIRLQDLVDGDYLNEIPTNPMTGDKFNKTDTITITYKNNSFTYKYKDGVCD